MQVRIVAIVVAVAIGSACASAPRTRSFQELPKYLQQNDTIRLTETGVAPAKGSLVSLSPASLTMLLADGTRRDVPEQRVARIGRPERRVGRGALAGLVVGFLVGLASARSQESSGNPYVDTVGGVGDIVAGAVLGAGAGAIAGIWVKADRTVYAPVTPPSPARTRP